MNNFALTDFISRIFVTGSDAEVFAIVYNQSFVMKFMRNEPQFAVNVFFVKFNKNPFLYFFFC